MHQLFTVFDKRLHHYLSLVIVDLQSDVIVAQVCARNLRSRMILETYLKMQLNLVFVLKVVLIAKVMFAQF